MVRNIAMLAVSALALAACQDEAGGGGSAAGARDQIRAVGSSTVFPFATAVAEQFVNNNPGMKSPIIESTGTGAGMKLFCAGVGAGHPDIEDASRRSEEHTSELQSLMRISYAVFCWKKKQERRKNHINT